MGKVAVLERFAKSKICDFDEAVVEKYVGRFEVSMKDAFLDEGFKGIEELGKLLDDLLLAQEPLLLDVLLEVSAIAEFVD